MMKSVVSSAIYMSEYGGFVNLSTVENHKKSPAFKLETAVLREKLVKAIFLVS